MSSAVIQSKPFIRRTLIGDLDELALSMREEDKQEILFSSGRDPLDALLYGYQLSNEVSTIVRAGKVVAIFGIVGTKGVIGSPWMLGADDLVHCTSLLRECREILKRQVDEYQYLTNACWSKNEVHVKWIKWLGFKFEGEDIRNGETFLHFHRRSHV